MCYGLLYKHKYCFQFYVFCASWKINKNMTIPMIIDCESHFGDYFLLSLYDRTNLFKAVFWIITHKAAANRNRLHKKKKKTFVWLIVCCGCKNYCTIKPEPIKKASPNTACLSHLCSSLDNRLPITDRKPELRHRGSTQGSNELTPCLLFAVLNQSTATNQYIPRMHVC